MKQGQIITIVLIDDDRWMTDLYGYKLKSEGFKVIVASNGKEGVELVMKRKPDLVLTDLVMPKGDGFYVIEQLKKNPQTKKIPVIALTNISNEADKQESLKMGAAGYLIKADHTPSDVVKKIKKLL